MPTVKDWLTMFEANYNGETPQAKELEQYIKKNYNGSTYIPWATMERMVYQQDPSADFRIEGLKTNHKNIRTNDGERITEVDFFVHMVSISLTFLGKVFTEVYPVQDNKYNAPKIIDANLVNKAVQRAKAKVASRATGLGLKLYEGHDLQFEDDTPEPKKFAKPEPPQAIKVSNANFEELVQDILNPANTKGLAKLNPKIKEKYGFEFGTKGDTVADTIVKLEQLDNPQAFVNSLKKNS
jgi:hypothetical protein